MWKGGIEGKGDKTNEKEEKEESYGVKKRKQQKNSTFSETRINDRDEETEKKYQRGEKNKEKCQEWPKKENTWEKVGKDEWSVCEYSKYLN